MTERLTGVAIKRDGVLHERGASIREHWRLRTIVNPLGTLPADRRATGDVDGFMSSEGRFVTRWEARDIAIHSGQLHERWKSSAREPLSSDINWDGHA